MEILSLLASHDILASQVKTQVRRIVLPEISTVSIFGPRYIIHLYRFHVIFPSPLQLTVIMVYIGRVALMPVIGVEHITLRANDISSRQSLI